MCLHSTDAKDLSYLSSSSKTCTIQLNIVKYINYVDDTNLLLTDNSLKKINRQVNHDLSVICRWLQANKINLNTSKIEIIIFWPKNKQTTKHFNFRISGQKINTCRNVKYLGVTFEENLDWNLHLNTLNLKLNKAIGLLCKIRHYIPKFLIKTLHYTITLHHYTILCIYVKFGDKIFQYIEYKIQALQDKAVQIINFRANNYVGELYKNHKIFPPFPKLFYYIRKFTSIQ